MSNVIVCGVQPAVRKYAYADPVAESECLELFGQLIPRFVRIYGFRGTAETSSVLISTKNAPKSRF